jgi:CRISPR-associated protein Csc1
MHIVRAQLTLMEKTFFSSREISNFYYTEPLVGNYALAYALGLCRSPYYNDGTIHYRAHLTALNEQGVYVTPATVRGDPSFIVGQFNAQPETYWSAMGRGVLVTRPDGYRMEVESGTWYARSPTGERKMARPANRPQHGRIRYLAVGNRAVFYVLSESPLSLPRYIRLGKFMSKAKLSYTSLNYRPVEEASVTLSYLLNPADLGENIQLHFYDLISVPPTPLIQHARLSGTFYHLEDGTRVPQGMRFGVEAL